jgi:DNA-binding transcriptional ArsR family regulator
MEAPLASKEVRLEKNGAVEKAVSYAVGHRIRVEVLALLNEGAHSPSQIAKLIRQPLGMVSHHITELRDAGSIELAWSERVRNAEVHYYRAVEIPLLSDEETRALPDEDRAEVTGLILQAIMAESLASFWAGKMLTDDDIWLSWRWFNLDRQGRREAADEQADSWKRLVNIEIQSMARCAESGEEAISYVMASMGFERNRTSDPPAWTRSGEKLNRR